MQELKQVSIFSKLSDQELQKVGSIVAKKQFPAGSVVFFEGDRSDALYVVITGSVKVYQTTNDGREKILKTLGKGEIFGEFGMLDGSPRSAAVATLENTEMLTINHRDFRGFANGAPDVLWKVIESLCDRLRAMTTDMTDQAFRDVPYRLIKALIDLAEKTGEKSNKGIKIKAKVSAQDLANMLVTNPQRVNRLLNKFQDESLIVMEGDHIVVTDLRTLRKALDVSQDWA